MNKEEKHYFVDEDGLCSRCHAHRVPEANRYCDRCEAELVLKDLNN